MDGCLEPPPTLDKQLRKCMDGWTTLKWKISNLSFLVIKMFPSLCVGGQHFESSPEEYDFRLRKQQLIVAKT